MEKTEYGAQQQSMVKENGVEYPAKEERTKEKVVYKVVPVPYYYPVPVDAEWYYKHHEPAMRNGNERGYLSYDDPVFDHFPFPPPTPHGFPPPSRSRDFHYYPPSGREEMERYWRPVSPLYRNRSPARADYSPASPEHESTRKQGKENGGHRSPTTTATNTFNSEKAGEQETKEKNEESSQGDENSTKTGQEEDVTFEKRSVKSEGEGEETNEESTKENEERKQEEECDSESDSNKRRRYMMSFPFDKLKKNANKDNEGEEEKQQRNMESAEDISSNENHIGHKRSRSGEFDERGRYMKHTKHYPVSGAPNGHYSYVVVRSPPFMENEMRSPRYGSPPERSHSMYSRHDDPYKDPYKEVRKGDMLDDKKEIRYHPNGRRARTVFTRQQLLTLNNVFEKHPFVSGERMSELSDQLGLDRKIVKIWFQNKRQYARKKGSLVERNEEYYYDYQDRYNPSSAPPTMAERWKNGN